MGRQQSPRDELREHCDIWEKCRRGGSLLQFRLPAIECSFRFRVSGVRMAIHILIERPAGPEIAALIEERMAHSRAILPPQSIHTFDLSQLDRPGILFWTVRVEGVLAGCGALKEESDGGGEIKSMFIRPAWLGKVCLAKFLKQ
jgi:hypothetical protein